MQKDIVIYQAENGALELKSDSLNETVWATQSDLVLLFDKDQSVISRHINNIFKDGEIEQKSNMQKMHIANSDKPVFYYSLDIILAVGYRTNSSKAILFRKWASKILKQYIKQGFSLNQDKLLKNKTQFLQTIENLKILSKNSTSLETKDILSLIQNFSNTFFVLDRYDKSEFPREGTLKEIKSSAKELVNDLQDLKKDLIKKGEATNLFAQEKTYGSLEGIYSNVFQSVFGQDAYTTVEQKAAHLLYFIIKNHPFTDGNKRSGAFSFIWLLQKSGLKFEQKISPETLTILTILIAESAPENKENIVGMVLLILNNN